MRYTLLLTVLITVLVCGLTACSSDIEEGEETTSYYPYIPEPIEPDWVDGVLTITVGNYQTGEEMLIAIETRRHFNEGISWPIRDAISDPDFPISQQQDTIDIAVVKLLEAGLNKPVTIKEIKSRYKELGYRSLTLEEAVELRLQFKEQPDISTGDRMSAFYILLKGTEYLTLGQQRKVQLLSMERIKGNDHPYDNGHLLNMESTESRTFDPAGDEPNPVNMKGKHPADVFDCDMVKGFAGVVE